MQMVTGGFAIRDNSKKFYATAEQTTATMDQGKRIIV